MKRFFALICLFTAICLFGRTPVDYPDNSNGRISVRPVSTGSSHLIATDVPEVMFNTVTQMLSVACDPLDGSAVVSIEFPNLGVSIDFYLDTGADIFSVPYFEVGYAYPITINTDAGNAYEGEYIPTTGTQSE